MNNRKKLMTYLIPIVLIILGAIGVVNSKADSKKEEPKDNGRTYVTKSDKKEETEMDESDIEVEESVAENEDVQEGFVKAEPIIITEYDATPESEAYQLVISDMDENIASQIDRYDAFVSTMKAYLYTGGATKDNVTVQSLNQMQIDEDGNKIFSMAIPEYGNSFFDVKYIADEDLYEIEY